MSINTWKQEFYPTPAKALKDAPLEEALDHCIQKWVGLRPTNLTKHNLVATQLGGSVRPVTGVVEHMVASATYCALCVKFYKNGCNGCPLNKGGPSKEEGCYDQWQSFAFSGNPEKMIRVLRDAKRKLSAPTVRSPTTKEQVLAAMHMARTILGEIATTGGKYGYHVGDIVVDATMVDYTLQKAMEQLERASYPK